MNFSELREALAKNKHDYQKFNSQKDQLNNDHTKNEQQLSDVEEKQKSLATQKIELEKTGQNQVESMKKIKNDLKLNQNAKLELEKQLPAVKQTRNLEVMKFWMKNYPEFDELSETELEGWLNLVIAKYDANTGSDDGSGVGKHLKTANNNLKQETEDNESKDSTNTGVNINKLAEVATNQERNDPIDTLEEAENEKALSRPLGVQNAAKESKTYFKNHPKSESVDNHANDEPFTKHNNAYDLDL